MHDFQRQRIAVYVSAPTATKFAMSLRLLIEEFMQ